MELDKGMPEEDLVGESKRTWRVSVLPERTENENQANQSASPVLHWKWPLKWSIFMSTALSI